MSFANNRFDSTTDGIHTVSKIAAPHNRKAHKRRPKAPTDENRIYPLAPTMPDVIYYMSFERSGVAQW